MGKKYIKELTKVQWANIINVIEEYEKSLVGESLQGDANDLLVWYHAEVRDDKLK